MRLWPERSSVGHRPCPAIRRAVMATKTDRRVAAVALLAVSLSAGAASCSSSRSTVPEWMTLRQGQFAYVTHDPDDARWYTVADGIRLRAGELVRIDSDAGPSSSVAIATLDGSERFTVDGHALVPVVPPDTALVSRRSDVPLLDRPWNVLAGEPPPHFATLPSGTDLENIGVYRGPGAAQLAVAVAGGSLSGRRGWVFDDDVLLASTRAPLSFLSTPTFSDALKAAPPFDDIDFGPQFASWYSRRLYGSSVRGFVASPNGRVFAIFIRHYGS